MKVKTALATLIFIITFVIALCQNKENLDQSMNQNMNRLKDKSFMKKHIDCVLDKAPCDKLGLIMKNTIPKMIVHNCQECNPSIRQNYEKIRNFMQQYYSKEWNAIIQRYSKRTSG